MSTWYCKIIWDHRFKWSKIGFGSHSSCWLCKVCESHLGAPWDSSNFLGSRPLISNGPWRFECSTSKKKIIQGHLNKGILRKTFHIDICGKLGQKPKWPKGQVPFRSPPAMPCFSAFEKVKESVKDSLKRRLNCASLLSRPSWISTCLPLDERPVSRMVDDTTQIPDDLYQSLLHAGRQAKSTTSGQHRTHLQPNGRLVLRLTSMTKAQEAQNLKFASLGEERQIGSFVKLDHLEKRPELNNLQGYISGWDESQQRFTVILEDGTRIALKEKNLKDPDKIESPFEAMDQFHKTCKKRAEEELKKLKPTVWHGDHNHNVTVDSWFSNFDLKW